jgi:hypothetical protein
MSLSALTVCNFFISRTIGPNDLLHPSPALSGVSRFHIPKTPCSKRSISLVPFFNLSPICWRKEYHSLRDFSNTAGGP